MDYLNPHVWHPDPGKQYCVTMQEHSLDGGGSTLDHYGDLDFAVGDIVMRYRCKKKKKRSQIRMSLLMISGRGER